MMANCVVMMTTFGSCIEADWGHQGQPTCDARLLRSFFDGGFIPAQLLNIDRGAGHRVRHRRRPHRHVTALVLCTITFGCHRFDVA